MSLNENNIMKIPLAIENDEVKTNTSNVKTIKATERLSCRKSLEEQLNVFNIFNSDQCCVLKDTSESTWFVIKAIIIWIIICIPGNLVTAIIYYKHWSVTGNSTNDNGYTENNLHFSVPLSIDSLSLTSEVVMVIITRIVVLIFFVILIICIITYRAH